MDKLDKIDKLKLINSKLQEKLQKKRAEQEQKQNQEQAQVQAQNKEQKLDSKNQAKQKAKKTKQRQDSRHLRRAAGQVWQDLSLKDWPEDDYRLFCGNLGNEITDEVLTNFFRHFRSFYMAKVVRDKRSGKTRGFGFVSLRDPQDFLKALELNGKYIGSQPVKISRSRWRDKQYDPDKHSLLESDFSHFRKRKGVDSESTPFIYAPRM